MPCYEVNTLTVEFQAKHVDLLESAARSLGMSFTKLRSGLVFVDEITIDLTSGEATYQSRKSATAQEKLNLLKRQYSVEAIKTAATRTGWSKEQVARLNARRRVNKVTVSRR